MTLTEFLLARIAEDEAGAEACVERAWIAGPYVGLDYYAERREFGVNGPDFRGEEATMLGASDAEHIARHDPARVLAECEAKRRIVEHFSRHRPEFWGEIAGVPLRALASVYADHPDYRPEWKP